MMNFESSERSDEHNWVKKEIVKNGLNLLSFEGYTVKSKMVSALFDRARVENLAQYSEKDIFTYLHGHPTFHLIKKVEVATLLECPYYFLIYSYEPDNSVLYQLSATDAIPVKSFDSFAEFGEWTRSLRDLKMNSKYHEDGLPTIDVKMRSAGFPWPGNLDYALVNNSKVVALIEFQNTSAASVANHCNNRWFVPSAYRKGDVNRWLAIDIIRIQSRLPLLIIVWSTKEKIVKLKSVEKIIYPESPEPNKGLIYRNKKLMDIEELISILRKF